MGCNDRISSFTFKKGLLIEHELTLAFSQTLADVFTMAECYAFLDDDRIAMKKSGKQVHQSQKGASEKNDRSYNRNNEGKRKSRLTEGGSSTGTT